MKNPLLFILTFGLSIIGFRSFAQTTAQIPPEKPRLVIQIVVDQMRYDYINRYWEKFEEGGFKRLIDEGTFCKNANFNYLFTQSAPGHATISTGTTPDHHAIVSDKWYVRLKDTMIFCTFDPEIRPVGGSFENGRHSPTNLLSTTIGDELRLSTNFRSKVFSIALKEQTAILSGGHTCNGAFWYDGITGTWMSSSYYLDSLPGWLSEFNEKAFPDLYLDREWNTLLPIEEYTESTNDTTQFEVGFGNRSVFPYDLERISRIGRNRTDYSILLSTPFGNTFTKDLALTIIMEEELGIDGYPDLLNIGFSSTDYIGLRFGPSSVEIEDTYIRLDKDIAHLLQFIDEYIGKKNVLVLLTSDHGVARIPDYLNESRIPSGYFNRNQAMSLLKSYLNVIYGSGDWVSAYFEQQIFLNHVLIEDSNIDLEEMQTRIARFMIQFSGVSNAITSSTLLTTNFTEGIFHKIQNGYHQKRSGDIIINLEPGWVEENSHSTGHNSAYPYDTHVPLIWYGWKISRSSVLRPVSMTDIAPTIAFFLNISLPTASTGQLLMELTR
ncbi:MAG: alkaline phosphatase family protein [Bacteroidales bacterium]|nr:MAG: alkaline phosphatase family protein [Bacteroidales bacterium]